MKRFLLVSVLLVLVAACTSTPMPTPVPPMATALPPTSTLMPPTSTPLPTAAATIPLPTITRTATLFRTPTRPIPTRRMDIQSLRAAAVKNARDAVGAPYLYGGKGRYFDAQLGDSAGTARWATLMEIKSDGYRWGATQTGRGLDCTGLVVWAYDSAYNPMGTIYHDNTNPIMWEDARQWLDNERLTFRMEHRFGFQGPDSVKEFLTKYLADPKQFALEPGDLIYFLQPITVKDMHVIMYVGDGNIIEAGSYDRWYQDSNWVVTHPLVEVLKGYSDWFGFVGLGRVITPVP